ncbi:phosphotransferase [Cellulomonas sp. SLBN-39]|uniref:phosphotransferase n=1 Tax=Cellulomonas sp. SLBN-39 TaxID=2768446 RepID=UPI001171BFF9|nr:phosphotransferase [Cellulomonas sp. SLBN-39]TQL02720.1 tRNA A-37 threonylcarbamoyl transferase component Bud32 [Cellulomonas sp. SLBN-39]
MDVVARGREAVVLDAGPGLVLRRYLDGRDTTAEVALHRHVGAHGYPVPQVLRQEPGGMLLERVVGPTLLEALLAGTTTAAQAAAVLARLHHDLHLLPAPPGSLAGTCVVHLDLHPANVLLSPSGPVVIDWASGRPGHRDTDVGHTAVVLAAAVLFGVDGEAGDAGAHDVPAALVRDMFEAFLAADHGADPAARLDEVAEHRARYSMPARVVEAATALVRQAAGA